MAEEGLYVVVTERIAEMLKKSEGEESPKEQKIKEAVATHWTNKASAQWEAKEECGVPWWLLKKLMASRKEEGREGEEKVHELMKGSKYFQPPAPVVEKNPELVARLERMRHQIENRLYAKMVANVSNEWVRREEEQSRADLKSGLDTTKLALNLLVSVIAVFAAAYWIAWIYFYNTIISICAGAAAAIIIFLIETFLFVLRGARLDAKVSQLRADSASGDLSPFPPIAPSLIEAARKEAEEARIARIEARREHKRLLHDQQQQLLLSLQADAANSINGNATNDNSKKIDETLPFANGSDLSADGYVLPEHPNAKNKKKNKKLAELEKQAFDNANNEPLISGEGATLDDDF